jgi:hypothetical protein
MLGPRAVLRLICLLLFLGSLLNTWQRLYGFDFPYLYVEANLLAHGRPMYAEGQLAQGFHEYAPAAVGNLALGDGLLYYPPSTGVVCLPLVLFALPVAQQIAFWVSVGILLYGLWRLMAVFAPQWELAWRLLALAVVLNSFVVRSALGLLQAVALVTGLLAFTFLALKEERAPVAFACTVVALCLKMTLGLPFVALLALKRQFGLLLGALALFGLINGVGFLCVGGVPAFADYRHNLARVDDCPVNSPDPHVTQSAERADWQYFLNGLHPNRALARRVTQALSALALLFLAYAAWRGRRLAANSELLAAFLAPLVCLSLLAVYHHTPDCTLLLVPLLLWRAGPPTLSREAAGIWFQGSVFLFACVRPFFRQTAQLLHFLTRLDVRVVEKMLSSALLTVALVAALIALNRTLAARLTALTEVTTPSDTHA